jgi:hypothetical protein
MTEPPAFCRMWRVLTRYLVVHEQITVEWRGDVTLLIATRDEVALRFILTQEECRHLSCFLTGSPGRSFRIIKPGRMPEFSHAEHGIIRPSQITETISLKRESSGTSFIASRDEVTLVFPLSPEDFSHLAVMLTRNASMTSAAS